MVWAWDAHLTALQFHFWGNKLLTWEILVPVQIPVQTVLA